MTIQIKIGKEILKLMIFNKTLNKFLGEQEQLYQLLLKFLSCKKRNLNYEYKDIISISKMSKVEKARNSIQTKYEWNFVDITLTNPIDEDKIYKELMDYFSPLYCLKSFPKIEQELEFKEFNYFSRSKLITSEEHTDAVENSHGFKTKPELYSVLKYYKIYLSIIII